MRTLVNLLNDDRGYVRIFAEQSGFGYEKSPHAATPYQDLFDRMSGYDSVESAMAAAQFQLQAVSEGRPSRTRRRRVSAR
ncbi:hypothetical protein HNQ60_002669 [Povalibacter uvarum]|uniref:Uncharacterized protein n=1 Tax=Povalibacter uvarum TaxID=732238 RepID=A0A841HNR9_9GAMM|nr:hypothetical protein [Povalibacter uvarum]